MESLDLTYKLFDLKIKVKHLTQSTLCFKYFRIVITKRKNKKIKITKIDLFLLPPGFPLRTGGGGGGCCNPPPTPIFSRQIFLKFFS